MHVPRVRFSIRLLMIAIVLASLIFAGIAARRERRRRLVALQVAQAVYQEAKLTREVAEIAVTEYVEGIYKQKLEAVEDEIARSDAAPEQARSRKAALEQESRDQIKMLKDEVTKARADELAKSAELQRAKAAVAGLGF
jgi:hypothetical protein